jgi:aryl-alcohol dehydrogenase-like predicted oxidoreductase
LIRRAVEVGTTLLDSADVYALDDSDIGHNERLIAAALADLGMSADASSPDVVVATKGGRTRPGGAWAHDARPTALRAACEASLRALDVECIALYQLHAPDPAVPFEESVGALAALRDEGKIRAVGLSNVDVAQIASAQSIVPISSVQNAFSPWAIGRRASPVVERCARDGIVFLAYGPLGGQGAAPSLGQTPALVALAGELGVSAHELALACLLHESPTVVPIPGATRVASVESAARALEISLDRDALHRVKSALLALPGRETLASRVTSKLLRMLRG